MYQLSLTSQQLSVINAALQEMPFRVAAPLVNVINEQLNAQAATEQKTSKARRPQQNQHDINSMQNKFLATYIA